ncbi:putative Serine/threonine-protein phosphatase 2A 56 kDa regulatory subunit gamma [Blattamonas nauphoetae]|uniref:Serine/threonine-protein phosphatase 2A 56 kDa regulatory subunit gamma n=1 Tax=Blattamonas nauphoetae TaxID=2049346 RepID=A0ABQ9Y127_9EUKA|nr:putative Serine/threonine-protein phosphatase 2A 56 kDa regulatory subunit gamma [Blattamonas nauphoetae]
MSADTATAPPTVVTSQFKRPELKKRQSANRLLLGACPEQTTDDTSHTLFSSAAIANLMDKINMQLVSDVASKKKDQLYGSYHNIEYTYPTIPTFPKFSDTPQSEHDSLLAQYFEACCLPVNWADTATEEQILDRERKGTLLDSILEYLTTQQSLPEDRPTPLFPQSLWHLVRKFVETNIIRELPPTNPIVAASLEYDEDDPVLERAWPHLQQCYEIFLLFILSPDVDPKISRTTTVDVNLVTSLFTLFASDDPRERDYIKSTIHRIYARYASHRPLLRRLMSQSAESVVTTNDRLNGLPEVLKIMLSIIAGLTVPIKQEYQSLFHHTLLQLHTPTTLPLFHKQLSQAVCLYLTKDPTLFIPLVSFLLRTWPKVHSAKETLLLDEISDAIGSVGAAELIAMDAVQQTSQSAPSSQSSTPKPTGSGPRLKVRHPLLTKLFEQISLSATSLQFQVAEKALTLFTLQPVIDLMTGLKMEVFPMLFTALHSSARTHWNGSVRDLSFSVLKLMDETDSILFAGCAGNKKDTHNNKTAQEVRRKWERTELVAKMNIEHAQQAALKVNANMKEEDAHAIEDAQLLWWDAEQDDVKDVMRNIIQNSNLSSSLQQTILHHTKKLNRTRSSHSHSPSHAFISPLPSPSPPNDNQPSPRLPHYSRLSTTSPTPHSALIEDLSDGEEMPITIMVRKSTGPAPARRGVRRKSLLPVGVAKEAIQELQTYQPIDGELDTQFYKVEENEKEETGLKSPVGGEETKLETDHPLGEKKGSGITKRRRAAVTPSGSPKASSQASPKEEKRELEKDDKSEKQKRPKPSPVEKKDDEPQLLCPSPLKTVTYTLTDFEEKKEDDKKAEEESHKSLPRKGSTLLSPSPKVKTIQTVGLVKRKSTTTPISSPKPTGVVKKKEEKSSQVNPEVRKEKKKT